LITRARNDVVVLAISAIAWAVYGYWPAFHALAFWVVPAVLCSALTVLVVCACLEASPLVRPFLALIPPALVLPVAIVRLYQGDWAGRFVADLLVYPALTAAAAYFAFALARRSKGKPKPA